MTLSALSGWLAFGVIPLGAVSGVVLRRVRRGRFALRMRPHYVLGYGAAGLAATHAWAAAGGMAGADGAGIWCATCASAALLLQLFYGVSLQAPGAYRAGLRRWHVITFWAVVALAAAHVVRNGPAGAVITALATAR